MHSTGAHCAIWLGMVHQMACLSCCISSLTQQLKHSILPVTVRAASTSDSTNCEMVEITAPTATDPPKIAWPISAPYWMQMAAADPTTMDTNAYIVYRRACKPRSQLRVTGLCVCRPKPTAVHSIEAVSTRLFSAYSQSWGN